MRYARRWDDHGGDANKYEKKMRRHAMNSNLHTTKVKCKRKNRSIDLIISSIPIQEEKALDDWVRSDHSIIEITASLGYHQLHTPKYQILRWSNGTPLQQLNLIELTETRQMILNKTEKKVFKIKRKVIEDWNSYWQNINDIINTQPMDTKYWELIRRVIGK
jgi:hypothetical protein